MKKKNIYDEDKIHGALEDIQDALISLRNSEEIIQKMINKDICKNGKTYSEACKRMLGVATKFITNEDISNDLAEINENLDSLEEMFIWQVVSRDG